MFHAWWEGLQAIKITVDFSTHDKSSTAETAMLNALISYTIARDHTSFYVHNYARQACALYIPAALSRAVDTLRDFPSNGEHCIWSPDVSSFMQWIFWVVIHSFNMLSSLCAAFLNISYW